MKDILKKLKILDEFSVELEIERSSFVRKMSDVVEPGTVSQFVPFEAFRASKKEYRGNVSDHEFRIRRQRRFFDSNRNWAVATGSLRQREANLIVDVEVSSFTYMFAFFYAFIIIFYLVSVG